MARKSRKIQSLEDNSNEITIYRVGIYARLSKEDTNDVRNNSIENQLEIIRNYLSMRPDCVVIEEYIDNGISGTSFERASFVRMLEDIKNKKINCIVVKDLSRFGRNYVEAGNYIETILPFMGVRFISVNDNFDSFDSSSGKSILVAVKNLVNEYTVRNLSKNIRASLHTKQ